MEEKIEALGNLASCLRQPDERMRKVLQQATLENPWFTSGSLLHAVDEIAKWCVDGLALRNWSSAYDFDKSNEHPRSIGVISAGNIPAVGFHDFLCIYLSGHSALLKLSDKDTQLMTYLIAQLSEFDKNLEGRVRVVTKLSGFDAVIATGSDNSKRYFNEYFGRYPHIIRGHRNAVAVLHMSDTDEQLQELGKDIFTYFGLGCRNVTKIYVPESFDVKRLFEAWSDFSGVGLHNKYKNNYEYNRAIYLVNRIDHLDNGFVILMESDEISGRIAMLNYSYYEDVSEVEKDIAKASDQIQCVASMVELRAIPTVKFGVCQSPDLTDYADEADVMQFFADL